MVRRNVKPFHIYTRVGSRTSHFVSQAAEAVSVSSVEQDLGTWRKKPLAVHSFQGCHLRDLWVLIEPDEIQDLL